MRQYIVLIYLLMFVGVANAQSTWLTLPSTPTLPHALHSGYAPINGVRIWYAEFGHGKPVILLHAGLANSNYWGRQVSAIAKHYRVVVMDSRGHGRSTRNEQPYSYDLMATDVIGLMDFLKIKRAAIVGWSDGAILGLDLALHHPERITKVFAFAANSDPSGTLDISKSSMCKAYNIRTKKEYEILSPTPKQYPLFFAQINKMWATEPNFTQAQLNAIRVPTWIVDGDHDEAIKRENTEFMAKQIPRAILLLQPNVSHYSLLQNPQQFTNDVLRFLNQ